MQFYVKDIMSTDLVTIMDNATITDLIKIFADKNILGVPVIDSEGYVVGVVSSVDVLKQESSNAFYYDAYVENFGTSLFEDKEFFRKPVSSIMSREIYSIKPDESISKMAKSMYDKKIHRLLVTEYNKLVGIVTTFDLLKLLASSNGEQVIEI